MQAEPDSQSHERCCKKFASDLVMLGTAPTLRISVSGKRLGSAPTVPRLKGAREQRAKPLCSATPRFLSLDSSSSPPDDLLGFHRLIPPITFSPRFSYPPPQKSQLHTNDEDAVLLSPRYR